MEEIKIIEVITKDITEPRNDGTPGSALYMVPFRLNRTPSNLWANEFVKVWNSPPRFTTLHRPGIARVSGDRIILDGTTIEEVKSTHKETLELCVSEANRIEAEYLQKQKEHNQAVQKRNSEFRRRVEEDAKSINFNKSPNRPT
jgi:hypothetical protein